MRQKTAQNGKIRVTMHVAALLASTALLGGVVLAQSNANDNANTNTNTNIWPVVNDNTNVAVTPPADSNINTNASPAPESSDPAVDQLNEQIDQKRQQIDELKRQTSIYERNLEQKQDERASLQAQVRDLGESIDQTETQLTLTQTEIEELQLEIQKVQRDIAAREEEIADHREELAGLLRRLYEADQVSQLELVVQEQTFSGFFSRVQTLHSLGSSLQETLNQVLAVKERLDSAKADLQAKRQELESAQVVLEQQQDTKLGFLDAAKDSEQQYQALLSELKRQSASVDSEIETLIQQVNDRLAARGEDITQLKPGKLSWPVNPSRGISAYFRDPTYPFRKIFEHPAVDIRAYHGTSVTAAADGVVAIARKLDWVRNSKGKILWPAYNFVTIVHGGDIATVYGHLSEVSVTEGQKVKRGQVIGKSGGTPGTAGAGRLTTGPHIHFEVRLKGIPVDPMGYLPEL